MDVLDNNDTATLNINRLDLFNLEIENFIVGYFICSIEQIFQSVNLNTEDNP